MCAEHAGPAGEWPDAAGEHHEDDSEVQDQSIPAGGSGH